MHTASLRHDFPLFRHRPELAYLDNASTTQKPTAVVDAERFFYEHLNANVHRGAYGLAEKATAACEAVREKTRAFLNAPSARQIIFTSGTTASINLVAQSFAAERVKEGDAILVTAMEHHANLIPWQQVCLKNKARLLVAPISHEGVLDMTAFEKILRSESGKVKAVAISHVSNVLGTVNPISDVLALARKYSAVVLVDAAQSIATHSLDVQALDADFLVFSGHKMFGPTGTGILYGKEKWLDSMSPTVFGGGMIRDVAYEKTTFASTPQKFEAGTPNMAGIVGLGAALDWIENIERENIERHVQTLLAHATARLQSVPGLRIIGQAPKKSGIISFLLGDIHPHDLATFLDQRSICVRAGHHCAQPLMDFLEIPGTVRASFSIYNSKEEIDRLVAAIEDAQVFFGRLAIK
ncbi:MAG: SufS family cysteine desulfurase [Saprospiraceae bacterium]|nr:SufS family cysteine desulfurase [Saprospiraceae bacterium]